MRKILRVILVLLAIAVAGIAVAALYVKTALPNVGPPASIQIVSTPARVARGHYLANYVAVCMDCHSIRDWSYYAGPLKQETFGGGGERFGPEIGFPGTVYSKNITPFGLHDWSDGEIIRTLTTGENKQGQALFPLMPYESFSQLDKEDLYSIIAYLRSLSPVTNVPPARDLDFPVSLLVNLSPSKAKVAMKPDTTNELDYGKYLTTMSSCIVCHSQVNKGERIAGTDYGGGRPFAFPNGTTVTSANITPDNQTGIGTWTKEMFIQRFKQNIKNPPPRVGPKDFNTVMPWLMYSQMSEQDLGAIYTYL
ncbi:MAG TPA: hypothetical protein VKR32_16265, partial [Puia sp.]|nr:hypothetical protein [Puia sp.]